MLVYLTSDDNPKDNYQTYNDIASFSRGVLDAEATEIMCENFVSGFDYNDVPKVLNLIFKKMRIGSKLTIADKDFRTIARQIFREESEIGLVNNHVFRNGRVLKSILTLEAIESLIPKENFRILSKGFDSTSFILTIKRIQ